ncbi:MAG: carotenoid oxygenase family protein [Pseudanabaenaceae cyanobacterium bins.68]|nr:carotenoid oxygenase family protein [Pseudanabaenaceae cyanobacterium bins.68]
MTTTTCFSRSDWQKGYRSLYTEHDYQITEISGVLPPDLQGTLYRNGPGLLDRNGENYGHPFDGDGMVCAIRLHQGEAYFRNRFVKTPEFLAEEAAGKILYRGVFGTQKPGGWLTNCFDLRLKNIANTNVIFHGQKLLALWEAARPYRLDPDSLATLGIEDFNQALAPGEVFTAHPKLDPQTGNLWAFGVETGPKSVINIFRLDPDGELTRQAQHRVPGFCFLHDFAFTPNYRIFLQNPVKFAPLPFLLGFKTAGACLDLKPNSLSKFLISDRQGQLITLETDPGFVFHHCNAYEPEPDQIILDSVCYATYPKLEPKQDFREVNFDQVVPGKLVRFKLNLKTKTINRHTLVERSCEFPAINPQYLGQPYRYAYLGAIAQANGNAPLQALLKLDLHTGQQQTYSIAPQGFMGEPVFVPRPQAIAEDDGWILTLCFNAASDRSELLILDAENLNLVASLALKHHVPYGLHGSFVRSKAG